MKFLKLTALMLSLSMCALAVGGCSGGSGKSDTVIAEMVIKGYGTVTLTLDRSQAPITVDHFVKLAKDGSYDGSNFIRMQAGFVLQGGDGAKDNSTIKGEFSSNGVKNNIKHKKGVISMARANDPNSASSQFFIVLDTSDMVTLSLDGNYAAFGEVTDGWDVIEKICADITSDKFTSDYYGQAMGFLKEKYYITIETVKIKE